MRDDSPIVDAREPSEGTPQERTDGLFGGDLRGGLDRLRRRLVDLTKRNRLLNFRHSKRSSLRIIDEMPDQVFSRLVEGESLSFKPIPQPAQTLLDGTPLGDRKLTSTAEQVARELGMAVDFDVPL